jgi:hypothetical protein
MNYIVRAENEMGLAQEYEIFTVFVPDKPNKKIYISGKCTDGLIPYIEDDR